MNFVKQKTTQGNSIFMRNFKIYRNLLANLTRPNKQYYYKKYFEENNTKICKVWKGIKEVIVINKSNKTQPTCLEIGNKNITIKKISEEFNNFFGTIAKKIDKKTPKPNHFPNYLKNQNLNSLFLDAATEEENESIIGNLNLRKTIGPNSIPTRILKEFKNILKIQLTIIINIYFQAGIVPEQCKIAHITLTFKKGDKLDSSNYRPVSLLPNISKILEKVMYTRLYNFLDKFKFLYKKQFGFRNCHSINHALVSITEEINRLLIKTNLLAVFF